MKPNWFVAFPVAADAWFAPLVKDCPDQCHAFADSDLHLTLAFFGALEPNAVDKVRAFLPNIQAPRLHFRFDQVLLLPPAKRFSAVCLGLGEGHAAVAAVMAEWRNVLAEVAGIAPETRTPLPHVTIARPKRKYKQQSQTAAAAWAEQLQPPEQLMTLDRLALYTWSDQRPRIQFRIDREQPLNGKTTG